MNKSDHRGYNRCSKSRSEQEYSGLYRGLIPVAEVDDRARVVTSSMAESWCPGPILSFLKNYSRAREEVRNVVATITRARRLRTSVIKLVFWPELDLTGRVVLGGA